MINFEDLEIGKEYLILAKDNLCGYHYKYYFDTIKIIRKGKMIPINYRNEIIEDNIYDYVSFIVYHTQEENDTDTLSTYKNEHLKYRFFTLDEDITDQVKILVEEYKQKQLEEIEENFKRERMKLVEETMEMAKKILEKMPSKYLKEDKKKKSKK